MSVPKRNLDRLRILLRRRERREAELQVRCGDRIPNTGRAVKWHEAEALRAVLAYFDVEQARRKADK